MDALNKALQQHVQKANNTGVDDFEGYSPAEMQYVIYDPMNKLCVVQFADLSKEDLLKIPLLQQIKLLGEIVLREGKLKLTPAGYLPLKVVKELYETARIKDVFIEKGISKLHRENECFPVHVTHIIAQCISIFSKAKGSIKVTKKGQKLLKNENDLLRAIIETFLVKFNWAYFDRYESETIGRKGGMFTFVLLKKYGSKIRGNDFYSQKYMRAFPFLMEELEDESYSPKEVQFKGCYTVRTFERFLDLLGLIEYHKEKMTSDATIQTTDLFRKLVKLKPHQSIRMAN